MKIHLRYFFVFLSFLLFSSKAFCETSSTETSPKVLVSIKPLHSWVSAVMEGVGTPELLIKGAESVHNYSFKPSDAREISESEVIFIVDPLIEHYLVKPLHSLAPKAEVVSLSQAPSVYELKPRIGGMFEAHDHGGKEHHHHHHGAAHARDLHFWLDPENAIAATKYIAQVLAKHDPIHRGIYERNAQAYVQKLQEKEQQLSQALKGYKDFPFIVFHDGYHYFENRFGVRAVGSITIHPENGPSARRVAALREKIKKLHAVCVFSEPQFKPSIIANIIEGTKAQSGTLDPLGADIPAGPEAYFTLLDRIKDSLIDCAGRAHKI